MIDALQKGFTRRPSGVGIFFTAHYNRNKLPSQIRLEDCDRAVLKFDDQTILIGSLQSLPNGRFTGVVKGFEPAFCQEYKGIKIGDEIIFDENYVFTAG